MTRPSIKALALVALLGLAACTPSTGSQATGTGNPGVTTPTGTVPGATTPVATGAATPAATPAASADATASIVVRDFELDPSTVAISGSTIGFAVTNEGPTVHNVTVRTAAGDVLLGSRDLREGESDTVVGAIPPGTYVLFCSLPGHESLGIKGTLTVTAP